MKTIEGPYGIKATILADSVSAVTGDRFTTYEIEYPRMILAELNTHRDKSRNSASSRAIPYAKMLEQLTARPVRFGEANPGMQDKGVDYSKMVDIGEMLGGVQHSFWTTPEQAWELARDQAIKAAKAFYGAGYHKQVYNRLVEPFQMMKTVISGTEWANFFWLRDHGAADPSIEALARVMHEAREKSIPMTLQPGEWHLPYVGSTRHEDRLHYFIWPAEDIVKAPDEAITMGDMVNLSLEDAIKVSCARCAAVSFRNTDYMVEKSREVYDRLVGDARKHASAFEHCATPMQDSCKEAKFGGSDVNLPQYPYTWEDGISHMDREMNLWSGNLRGFIQYRKLIDGENYTGR